MKTKTPWLIDADQRVVSWAGAQERRQAIAEGVSYLVAFAIFSWIHCDCAVGSAMVRHSGATENA